MSSFLNFFGTYRMSLRRMPLRFMNGPLSFKNGLILSATLGIQQLILGVQISILGMASHDLSNTKTTILGATLGAIPRINGNL